MRVKDLMKREVMTIGAKESAGQAMERMKQNRIRHLVVVDRREVVGVMADRDLIGRDVRELQTLHVADVMSADPATIEPDQPIGRAANRMRGRGIGCLPVLDDGRLVGIITTSDLLETITSAPHAARRSIRDQPTEHASEKPLKQEGGATRLAPTMVTARRLPSARKQRRARPSVRPR